LDGRKISEREIEKINIKKKKNSKINAIKGERGKGRV